MAGEEQINFTLVVAGDKMDGFEIKKILGQGGMGTVVFALNEGTKAKVAIKFLAPDQAGNQKLRDRFAREAQAANIIDHDGFVRVHSTSEFKGVPYMVMEFVEGLTLDVLVSRLGPLPLARVIKILAPVAAALQKAHERGFVHRDIKMDNIMWRESTDTYKILDFGIAKLLDEDATSHTRTGAIMGTLSTMSPEQARGLRGIDRRSDIYSLGCVAYALFTGGHYPFPVPEKRGLNLGTNDLLLMHCMDPPPDLTQQVDSVPVELAEFLQRCLAKDPNDRPQTMTEFLEALLEFADPHTALTYTNPSRAGVVANSVHDGKASGALARKSAASQTRSVNGEVLRNQGAPKRRGAGLFVIAGLAALLVGVGGFAIFHNAGTPTPSSPKAAEPAATTKGAVRLTTLPPGALAVTADGHELGLTPVDVTGDAGEDLDVKLTLGGFATKVQTVHIKTGRSELAVTLDATPVARPVEKPVAAEAPKVSHSSGESKRTGHKSSTVKTTESHQKDELPTNLMGQ